jgi:hypothetical protein
VYTCTGQREQPAGQRLLAAAGELDQQLQVELVAHAARELDQLAGARIEPLQLGRQHRDGSVGDAGGSDPVFVPGPAHGVREANPPERVHVQHELLDQQRIAAGAPQHHAAQ